MKYVIDRIENDIAILEEINTKEIVELNIKELPNDIEEGKVLIKVDDNYLIDEEEKIIREKEISERFKNLFK